jgi:hypothetical protein
VGILSVTVARPYPQPAEATVTLTSLRCLGGTNLAHYTPNVGRTLIERRLRDLSGRLKTVRSELSVAEEQLEHLAEEADDARLRALVSETPLAEHEHHEAARQADTMRRHRDSLVADVAKLEADQDALLDRLVSPSA